MVSLIKAINEAVGKNEAELNLPPDVPPEEPTKKGDNLLEVRKELLLRFIANL
jgi:hypothetical protein